MQKLSATTIVPAGETTVMVKNPGVAFCPVSQRFDSDKALERLARPSEKDRQRSSDAPQRPGLVVRVG